MYSEAVIGLAVGLTIAASAVLQQEPDFPILSLLTYWSEAENQKDPGSSVAGNDKDAVDNNSNNGKGGTIRATAGKKLHLKCHPAFHHTPHRLPQWHFLPCGPGYNRTSCKVLRSSLTTNTEWQLVQSRNQFGELVLEAPSEADSGLYKCTTFRHDSTFKVLRMFQLEVIDGTVHPPEIAEGPWNVSVACCGGQRASLQCRVKSSVQPNVVWFRKISISPDIQPDNFIIYREAGWKMLPSNQMYLGDQMYLSKLSFDQPTTEDSGYYACLAINYKGWTVQGAQLNVYLPGSQAPIGNTEREVAAWGGFRFSGLFLIPACLALVPASAWLCYLYHKPRNKHTASFID